MPTPVTVSEEQLQNQFTYIDAVASLIRDKRLPIPILSAASRTRRIPNASAACCTKWVMK